VGSAAGCGAAATHIFADISFKMALASHII
jgi:hypothetical protein